MLTTETHIQPLDYDLVIVGGGIVGLTCAAAFINSNLRIAIVERQRESESITKGRAYVLSMLSGRIFNGLGIWSEILPQISQFTEIQISDGDYTPVVHLYPEDLGTKALGYAASHEVLLGALERKIAGNENITHLCPAIVEEVDYHSDRAIVTVKQDHHQRILHTKLIVAADGAKSPLRQQANINTFGWAYWQSCVTATVTPSIPHRSVAYERFWYDGPLGVLPLANGKCQIVWTAPHQKAEEIKTLPPEEFLSRLETATGGLLGNLTLDSNRFLFPVKLMQCENYVKSRLALIGDAAHCCHPVAGQGMNLGIRDAASLSQIIIEAHERGEDIGDMGVLKRYESWRKPENLGILGFTDFLDRFFSNRILPIMFIRRIGLMLLQNIQPLKHLALRVMTGLAGIMPQLANTP
jgi:2-octaprenyl-6-methoxyphenol hydroxylase